MATQNIFDTVVALTAPGLIRFTPAASSGAGVLTAAQFIGGIHVPGIAGAVSITSPSAASIGAALFGVVAVGDAFEFVTQSATDANATTLTPGAGMTPVGNMVSPAIANTSARVLIRCTTAPTNSAGLNSAFTIYRMSGTPA